MGYIPSHRLGRMIRFEEDEIREWADERRQIHETASGVPQGPLSGRVPGHREERNHIRDRPHGFQGLPRKVRRRQGPPDGAAGVAGGQGSEGGGPIDYTVYGIN
jgi:hypothetical protein